MKRNTERRNMLFAGLILIGLLALAAIACEDTDRAPAPGKRYKIIIGMGSARSKYFCNGYSWDGTALTISDCGASGMTRTIQNASNVTITAVQ